jgi:hypothetical protein
VLKNDVKLLTLIVLITSVVVIGDTSDLKSVAVLSELRSKDLSTRSAAKLRIIEERKDLIAGLIDLVKHSDDEEEKAFPGFGLKRNALELLGEIRAAEAIPILFENLTHKVFVAQGSLSDFSNPSKNYPSVGSLIKIGTPALEKTWYRIQMSDDPLERKLCCWILREVQGKEVAHKLMEEKASAIEDTHKKRNYEAALRLFRENNWTMPQTKPEN